MDGNKRHSWGQTLVPCRIDSGISLLDSVQNDHCSEKDLGVGVNEGYRAKETGPSAALGREMKKIEALLVEHPCLEDSRYTAAGTSEDLPSAFDLAADGPIAHWLVLGFEGLGGVGSHTARAIELEAEMMGQHFGHCVAGLGAVENLSPEHNQFGVDNAGRILPVPDSTAANTHLSHLRTTCPDFPSHCGRIVKTHVEDDHVRVPDQVGPEECQLISFAAVVIRERRFMAYRNHDKLTSSFPILPKLRPLPCP